ALKRLEERAAPLADRCAEYKTLNEALNRQLEDLRSQNQISRDKYKMAKRSLQTEKEETERLRLAFERQITANKAMMKGKNETQAKLEEQGKEVNIVCFLFLNCSIFYF
ncbi:hypothetical protein BYT27DRAFT_7114935, partial [Phlegmacium glaucopus]